MYIYIYIWARLKRETTEKNWDIVKTVMKSKPSDPVPRIFSIHHIPKSALI